MKVAACIPARGGSKRIPKKNIIDLCGKPLISYVIETSKQCPLIDEVWVSTDCKDIAKVSKQYGANVLTRPDDLAGDLATSESALIHFCDNIYADVIVFLQATSPLTQLDHLKRGVELITNGKADSCLSVCEDVRFYWNSKRQPINYDVLNRPFSQNKDIWYKETGAFYITTRQGLLESKCRLNGKIDFVVVPELFSFEIDSYEDLNIVKHLIYSNAMV